nr:hypothetical protein [Streptomyces sp. NRRL S-146]
MRVRVRQPGNRRFHAEPVACSVCGPQLAWADQRGEDALWAAAKTIAGGGIVAVKGLGGYQLVCDIHLTLVHATSASSRGPSRRVLLAPSAWAGAVSSTAGCWSKCGDGCALRGCGSS